MADSTPHVLIAGQTWARTIRRTARLAIWALPAYAAMLGWLPLAAGPHPLTDPQGWASHVTNAGYGRTHLAAGVGAGLFGLVALAALAVLLAGARSRRLAGAGLLAGFAAVTLQLPQLGVASLAAPPLGRAALDGDPAAAEMYDQAYGGGVLLVAVSLLSLAWILLGLAVWRSRALNRADGALLLLAGPLVGVAGLWLGMLVAIGSLLLLAGGVGIAWQASKLLEPARPKAGQRPGQQNAFTP